VQFLAWLESYGFSRRDTDFCTSAGVTSNACFARANTEDAKSAKFDPIAIRERFLEALENGIDCSFCLGSWQTSPLDDVMHNILLDQCSGLLVN